jgi:anaerobic magnesium-protoporphyrin IX monomethyl ester cyclase
MPGEVIIIAMNQEFTADQHLRGKFRRALRRSQRHAPRIGGLDLVDMQRTVEANLLESQLTIDGHLLGLLDLVNYVKNGRSVAHITPENAAKHLSLADTITLNGIYLSQFLAKRHIASRVILNYFAEKGRLTHLLRDDPLAVAISSTFVSFDDIAEIARFVKGHNDEIPIIVGGALIKKVMDKGQGLKEQTLKWLEGFRELVDFFVIESEGELTLVKILDALTNRRPTLEIENTAFYDGPSGLAFTPRKAENIDLDEEYIQWDRVDPAYRRRTLPISTSRGCQYRCRFCTYRNFFKGVKYKSLGILRRELKSIPRDGSVRHIRFTDDNFTASAERLSQICQMMIDEDLPFGWSSFARPDAITGEIAALMSRSGCEFLEMGIESGNEGLLRKMGKGFGIDQVKRAVDHLKEHGIAVSGAFILGYPGETDKTIQQTIDFINQSGLSYYRLNFFHYSGSMLLHREREKHGIIGLGWAWKHNTMDAAEASGYYGHVLANVNEAVTDGLSSTWETYKLLRGEGYPRKTVYELFVLSNRLNRLRLKGGQRWNPHSGEAEEILRRVETLIEVKSP